MQPILIKFRREDLDLIRCFTLRAYCFNERSKVEAIKLAVHLIEKAPEFNMKELERLVRDDYAKYFMNMPFHVSFSLLYKEREDLEKFLAYVDNFME